MSDKPLAIDLFCGLGGWADGLLAAGFRVVGFDTERHVYDARRYPAQLVLQDVLTLHGSQFRDAALIVASPPCQAYSYRAMPWSRAKALPPPDNTLFEACFRIQREACEAAGRHVPLIVENVRGAQKWVGRARWNFGSYYLWGDVPALMPIVIRSQLRLKTAAGEQWNVNRSNFTGSQQWTGDHRDGHTSAGWTGFAATGKSWRNQERVLEAYKSSGMNWSNRELRGQDFTRVAGRQAEGTKQGGSGGRPNGTLKSSNRMVAGSSKRRQASAMIAKIPLPLARHIGMVFHGDL